MTAIEPPRSSGRMLDALDFDMQLDDDGALEIDCLPSSQSMREEQPRRLLEPPPSARGPAPARQPTPTGTRRVSASNVQAQRGPASTAGMRRASSSSMIAAVDPRAAVAAFAGFGDSPSSLWATPAYALRVFQRRRVLRKDREVARRHRSPDVALYDSALRSADSGAVRTGVLVFVVQIVLAAMFCVAVVQALAAALAVGR